MNSQYLFGAFALVAAVFFIHNMLMSSRQARLEKKIAELRSHFKDGVPR
jgi:hypothetical protein